MGKGHLLSAPTREPLLRRIGIKHQRVGYIFGFIWCIFLFHEIFPHHIKREKLNLLLM